MLTSTRADVEEFVAAFDEFNRAGRRARGRFHRSAQRDDLSVAQYHLLEPLARAGEPLPVGAVADSAGVSAPSATRMLDGLEDRGLVARVRADDDRRVVRVTLTDEGARLVAAKDKLIVDARRTIFDQLSDQERRAAARVLRSLAAAIDDLHP